jgi:hypothetical protein
LFLILWGESLSEKKLREIEHKNNDMFNINNKLKHNKTRTCLI